MNTKSRLVFAFINAYLWDYNTSPELYEIKEACHIRSDQTVQHHLRVLEEYGMIERHGDNIKVLNTSSKPLPRYSQLSERIFQCIYLHIKSGNYPTQQEIAEDCEVAPQTVGRHIMVLEQHGKIKRIPYARRSIRLA